MTKTCHIILHYRDEKKKTLESLTFPLKVNEQDYLTTPIPEALRNSTYDAVKLAELRDWSSLQLSMGKAQSFDDDIKILQFLRYSFAYRAYNFFNVEYAEVIRLSLIEQHKDKHPAYEPTTEEIFEIMYTHGLFPHRQAWEMAPLFNQLDQQLQSRNKMGADKLQSEPSYDEKHLDDSLFNAYFNKLGVSKETNTRSPEYYLANNFYAFKESEPLLHVRECEDIGCSINPNRSPFIRMIGDSIRKKIVEYVAERHEDNDKPFLYGGFASGLMRRDLEVVKELIDTVKKSNMELFFIDKSYANFINTATQSADDLTMDQHVDITFLYKTITEFAGWVTSRLESDSDRPFTLHLFSEAEDAQAYLEMADKKLTLLVGQDYFTEDGCSSHRYSTPSAHDDFMRLAKSSLDHKGRFFEAIKNDMEEKIFFHVGEMKEAKYHPVSTKMIWAASRQSRIYDNTSLAFFTRAKKDNPEKCEKGANYTEFKYDEHGTLLETIKHRSLMRS